MRRAFTSPPRDGLAHRQGSPNPCRARIGWRTKRQTGSHRVLKRPGYPDVVLALHDGEEVGPRMLARLAKHRGLKPEDR